MVRGKIMFGRNGSHRDAVALSSAALGDASADEAFPRTGDNVVPRYTAKFQAIKVGLQRFGG
ncbi:hypothetical protein [Sphingomonas sp. GM_Shp_1]|uniref:hypothetical protein n=1 Tax=Sphingomonas sp. GM_Shp_1 TaxID=2937381 RepID=UPI00226B9A4E|nr:hypothetical protein [Sphingomonas sp. GM_Shp_1]